jgi:hypothetical protein
MRTVTNAKIQHHITLTATTRIAINFLSVATIVKQNTITAARMNAGNRQINEKNITDN